MSIKLTAPGRGHIHNRNANCTLQQVEGCYDLAQLKEWCQIVQQDIVDLKVRTTEAELSGDEDTYVRLLAARKDQKRLVFTIQRRLTHLKAQKKLLDGNEDFESFLIDRVRQAMGAAGFERLLEQARRDYRYQKSIGEL